MVVAGNGAFLDSTGATVCSSVESDRLNQMLVLLRRDMVDVAVIGAGQTKYGNHQLGLKGMWAEAAEKAFASVDKNFDPRQVDEAFIGSVAFG